MILLQQSRYKRVSQSSPMLSPIKIQGDMHATTLSYDIIVSSLYDSPLYIITTMIVRTTMIRSSMP